jgi:hypothetical protein
LVEVVVGMEADNGFIFDDLLELFDGFVEVDTHRL